MFIISKHKDTIRVDAQDSGSDTHEAIKAVINRKYCNKIVTNVGLAICVFDVLNCSEGMVFYGDGCLYYKVIFRLVILRPAIDEAFEAKVQSCTEAGLRLTTKFFEDIYVQKQYFPKGTAYDSRRARWFWYPDNEPLYDSIQPAPQPDRDHSPHSSDNEDASPIKPNGHTPHYNSEEVAYKFNQLLLQTDPEDRYYIELGEIVRVRTVETQFNDSGPMEPPKGLGVEQAVQGPSSQALGAVPFTVYTSMQEPGLGVVGWWRPAEEEAEEEGMED